MIQDHLLALLRRYAPRLRCAGLALTAALGVACAPEVTPLAADPANRAAVFGPNDLPPGTRVQVNRGGQWLAGKIVQPLGSDRFVISYDGAGPEWNEPVGMDRIRSEVGAGTPILPRDYRAGEKVLVKTEQKRVLLADVVQQVGAELWRVHYDGYGPEAAESVGPDRLRRPYYGLSAHAAGEAVSVDVNGQPLPARIIALSAADRWLVRFDAYGPTYDQEVGAERLRAVAPPPPVVAPMASAPPVVAPPSPSPAPASPAPDKASKKGGRAEPPPPEVAAPLQVGDSVVVSEHGTFAPGAITAVGSAGRWKIHFDGAGGDEEIANDRVVRLAGPLKGVKYQPSQSVFIEWHGVYVTGRVLKEQDKGQYKVRFDGQGPETDEIVPTKRLRPR